METKAHHALVGFFVVFLAAAAALFTLWISQIQFDREFEEYDVVFDGPVRGLRESSEVRFNGIQVGEVIDLGLNPNNPNEVIARIRVDAATPVKVDSFAQLEPQGLTGLSYIQLSGGSPGAEALQSRSGDRPARIFARQAQLEGLVEGGETAIENAQSAPTRVSTFRRPPITSTRSPRVAVPVSVTLSSRVNPSTGSTENSASQGQLSNTSQVTVSGDGSARHCG